MSENLANNNTVFLVLAAAAIGSEPSFCSRQDHIATNSMKIPKADIGTVNQTEAMNATTKLESGFLALRINPISTARTVPTAKPPTPE